MLINFSLCRKSMYYFCICLCELFTFTIYSFFSNIILAWYDIYISRHYVIVLWSFCCILVCYFCKCALSLECLHAVLFFPEIFLRIWYFVILYFIVKVYYILNWQTLVLTVQKHFGSEYFARSRMKVLF